MAMERVDSLIVPDDELTRQATDAIAGFGYQLYQTVSAWMSLKPGEQLFVEMAEDFAVATGTTLEMTQVKRTRATVTLHSKGVLALIRALWAFQEANPSKVVSAAFITTSQIGKEKGLSFPKRIAGLTYWRIGAREQADVEPLRSALSTLDLPGSLKAYLETATPDDIRNRILRPIHWYTAAPSTDELEREIEDLLVLYGQQRGVGAQDSRNALNALVVELLRCVRQPNSRRYVTATDLASVFERVTYRLVPPSLLQGGLSLPIAVDPIAETSLNLSDAASIPLPPRATLREDVVNQLHGALVSDGIAWLQGSSGLGKTTLALLIARRQNALWQFADLRDLKSNALRLALTRLATSFVASGARGLILDDLPPDLDNAAILAMRRVARAVSDADGVLVVTSTKPPAPTLKSNIDIKSGSVKVVPYFTEQDVAEVIVRAGGDAARWARLILISTGGHPQLVDARIMGLRQRGWPKDELWVDILPTGRHEGDVEQERQVVRGRLLHEMDEASRDVLFRLSLLTSNFDRALALVAASAPPAVAQAGLLFDTLVGPWIEQVGSVRFRLSQLLRDSGQAALGQELAHGVRAAVLDHLLGQRPFPADQLGQVFILAFTLRHVRGLAWFSHALISKAYSDKELFRRLAEQVSVFARADRGASEPLFPEDLHISSMLRYAQFLVAIAVDDLATAGRVLDRALAEAGKLDGKPHTYMLCLILSSAIMERALPLPPSRWLMMLRTLSELSGVGDLLHKRPPYKDPFTGLTINASNEEVLFVLRASALTSIGELSDLIFTLDKLPVDVRDRYLACASSMANSIAHIVSSAWISEVKHQDFDAGAAADSFARMRLTVQHWNASGLAVELACAQAVMLDDYMDDERSALAVLAEAQGEYPGNYRINRQRQKVHYRHGRHGQALAEFEIFFKSLDRAGPVESAFALREAGRSAAEIGELDRARLFFGKAWQALQFSSDQMLPMKAGLSGDRAILEYQAGKTDEAVALMVCALAEAEGIDPTVGLKEHYCVLMLGATLLWMRGARSDWPCERQAMVIGMCSDPDPLPELMERPIPQRLLYWYQLAELEADVSDQRIALAELRKRTKGGKGLLPMELTLTIELLRSSTRKLNIGTFLEAMPTYSRAVDLGSKLLAARSPHDILNMPTGVIEPIEGKKWVEAPVQEIVRSAMVLFALSAVSQGRCDIYDAFQEQCLNTDGMNAIALPLFELIKDPPHNSDNPVEAVARILKQMVDREFVFDAMDTFGATVVIVQFLAGHAFGEAVATPVLSYFRVVWREVITNRSFSMRNPSATGPDILAAFDKGITDAAKLANVVLASEAAVRASLSNELRVAICGIAERDRKPVDYIN